VLDGKGLNWDIWEGVEPRLPTRQSNRPGLFKGSKMARGGQVRTDVRLPLASVTNVLVSRSVPLDPGVLACFNLQWPNLKYPVAYFECQYGTRQTKSFVAITSLVARRR
jgi:hypothetical protein